MCVFMCVQGLLIPQGLDLGCYEQMVIIRKAQKAAAEDRGCCFKSLCSQIDFSNLDWLILFSTRQAKVAPFNPQRYPHLLHREVLLSVVVIKSLPQRPVPLGWVTRSVTYSEGAQEAGE